MSIYFVTLSMYSFLLCDVIFPVTAVPPKCPVDIVILLDESGSIGSGNFNLIKSFLSRLIGWLDIDSGNTRVGLVKFSTNVGTSINLNVHSSVVSLQSAILALSYDGGSTDTAAGLRWLTEVTPLTSGRSG